jgi:hypothetical protein
MVADTSAHPLTAARRALVILGSVSLLLTGVRFDARVHAAPATPTLAGNWILNHALSDLPTEAGFDPDWSDTPSSDSARGGGGGGGRGGRGGGNPGGRVALAPSFLSQEESNVARELVSEVTHPAETLTITQTPAAVTIAGNNGITRTFNANGKDQTIQLKAAPIGAVTKWEGAQLSIRFLVAKNQELRTTLSRTNEGKLLVTSQFADHGRGQVIKRVYDEKATGN